MSLEKEIGHLGGVLDITRQELQNLKIKVDSEITSIRNEFKEIKKEIKESSDDSKKEIKNDIKELKIGLNETLQEIKEENGLMKTSISELNTYKNKQLASWQTITIIAGLISILITTIFKLLN